MTDVARDLRDCIDRLAVDHDIHAITLQVCDRTSEARPRVVQLLNLQVPGEASHTYQARRVFEQDPFTNVELNEAADLVYSDAPIAAGDARIQAQRPRCGDYWSFLDHFGMTVEGVSTRRLRRGVFTVAGFLRDRRRAYASDLSLDALGAASTVLHNMMAAQVLGGVLRTNAGLMGLQKMLEPPAAAGIDAAQVLSRRELEVAELVGMGRQTKEVAFRLQLSEHTVENHLRRIYGKLGIHSRTALAHLMG